MSDTIEDDRIDALEETVTELEDRVASLESRADAGELGDGPGMRDFIDETCPENHVHRAVAIGAYLDLYTGVDGFTTNDIADGYREIRIPEPGNLSDVLRRAEKQDYIMPLESEGQAKRWQLAVGGEALITERREAQDS